MLCFFFFQQNSMSVGCVGHPHGVGGRARGLPVCWFVRPFPVVLRVYSCAVFLLGFFLVGRGEGGCQVWYLWSEAATRSHGFTMRGRRDGCRPFSTLGVDEHALEQVIFSTSTLCS